MDPRLDANRISWDNRVAVHAESQFYGVERWLRDVPGPSAREVEVVGDVVGKTLVHLQCHFGMDTLRWARIGAIVTGVDFSPVAIQEAISLAARAGSSEYATFTCANVYDAPTALEGRTYDVVYVSLGALCWLPDIGGWAAVVRSLLAPGGQLFIHDVHPFSSCLDADGDRIIHGYFEDPAEPVVEFSSRTYTDGGDVAPSTTYEWNHSLSEIFSALLGHGLMIDSLLEHDWTVFQQFPWLTESSPGYWVAPRARPRIPLSFTLLAHRSD